MALSNKSPLSTRWEFPKIWATLFRSPYTKDPTISGAILGSPIFGNPQIKQRSLSPGTFGSYPHSLRKPARKCSNHKPNLAGCKSHSPTPQLGPKPWMYPDPEYYLRLGYRAVNPKPYKPYKPYKPLTLNPKPHKPHIPEALNPKP